MSKLRASATILHTLRNSPLHHLLPLSHKISSVQHHPRAKTHQHLVSCNGDREIRHSLPPPLKGAAVRTMARGTMCTPPKELQYKTFLALPNLGLVEELGEKLLKRSECAWCECERRVPSLPETRDQVIATVGSLFLDNNIFEAKNGKEK